MGKFVIKQTSDGGYSFNLVASNGEVIGTSQTYRSLSSAKGGVESVRKNYYAKVEDQTYETFDKIRHPKFELYKDNGGEFRFRLKAMNGEIVLASEGYTTKTSAKNGIDSVRRNAEGSTVVIQE